MSFTNFLLLIHSLIVSKLFDLICHQKREYICLGRYKFICYMYVLLYKFKTDQYQNEIGLNMYIHKCICICVYTCTHFYIFFLHAVSGLEYPLACASPTLETIALCLSEKFFLKETCILKVLQ